MGSLTINFNNNINVSIQSNTGDIVYFKNSNDEIYRIGECTAVTDTSITCEIANSTPRPAEGDFIFFAKSPEINTSGILGYYATVDMENTSTSKAELFAVNTEMFISSQ